LPKESQTLVEDVSAEELSAEEQYQLRRYVGECLPSGTPFGIFLEEILMADDVGGCLPDGTHSSIILEGTPMADGDDCNSMVSLEETYPSSHCDRAETLDPNGTDRSVDVSPVLGLTTRRAYRSNQCPNALVAAKAVIVASASVEATLRPRTLTLLHAAMRVESGHHSRLGLSDVCLVALFAFLLWIRVDKSKRIVSFATTCIAEVRFCKRTARQRRLPSMSQHPLLRYARFQKTALQSSTSGHRSLLLAYRLPDALLLPPDDSWIWIWCDQTGDSFSVISFLLRLVLTLLKYLLLVVCWNCQSMSWTWTCHSY
jgi:hypothetical protein